MGKLFHKEKKRMHEEDRKGKGKAKNHTQAVKIR